MEPAAPSIDRGLLANSSPLLYDPTLVPEFEIVDRDNGGLTGLFSSVRGAVSSAEASEVVILRKPGSEMRAATTTVVGTDLASGESTSIALIEPLIFNSQVSGLEVLESQDLGDVADVVYLVADGTGSFAQSALGDEAMVVAAVVGFDESGSLALVVGRAAELRRAHINGVSAALGSTDREVVLSWSGASSTHTAEELSAAYASFLGPPPSSGDPQDPEVFARLDPDQRLLVPGFAPPEVVERYAPLILLTSLELDAEELIRASEPGYIVSVLAEEGLVDRFEASLALEEATSVRTVAALGEWQVYLHEESTRASEGELRGVVGLEGGDIGSGVVRLVVGSSGVSLEEVPPEEYADLRGIDLETLPDGVASGQAE